jgi:hypothetical protein
MGMSLARTTLIAFAMSAGPMFLCIGPYAVIVQHENAGDTLPIIIYWTVFLFIGAFLGLRLAYGRSARKE